MHKSPKLSNRYQERLLFVHCINELGEKSKIGVANDDAVEKNVLRNRTCCCSRRDNEVRLQQTKTVLFRKR